MNRKNMGFSLAELMIVIAIIVVLAGIVAVSVIQQQRSLALTEEEGIAKEIFVAAQTHLTMAESQGYLGISEGKWGTEELDDSGSGTGVYYFIVTNGKFTDPTTVANGGSRSNTILGLMLPYGAVDETVLSSGSYIIRYHKEAGLVLDVFYCTSGDGVMTDRYSLDSDSLEQLDDDYNYNKKSASYDDDNFVGFYAGDSKEKKQRRLKYKEKFVLGWYGGVDVDTANSIHLVNPRIIVHNEAILWVEIENANANASNTELILRVTGTTSENHKDIVVPEGTTKVILDDITAVHNETTTAHTGHFYDLFSAKGLTPGENIEVQALFFYYTNNSKSSLVKLVMSNVETTNSLYGTGTDVSNATAGEAVISNIRHLENLSIDVSNAGSNADLTAGLSFASAVQVTDLYWADEDGATEDFVTQIRKLHNDSTENPAIYEYDQTGVAGFAQEKLAQPRDDAACYYPVSPDYELTYNGQNYAINCVKVDCSSDSDVSGDAGLFGKPAAKLAVSNLQLVDFSIKGKTSAGTLAGTLNVDDSSVTNVLARNSKFNDKWDFSSDKPNVAASGNAGGLIGSLSGDCTVSKSAAAVFVKSTDSTGSAGGLVGAALPLTDEHGTVLSQPVITACYSGGHTKTGAYYNDSGDPMYNVISSSGSAGGLVGRFFGEIIEYSYSTCSASGVSVGGLVGTVSGGKIADCYATGLVSGTTMGALVGEVADGITLPLEGDIHYFKIINKYSDDKDDDPIKYRNAVGSGKTSGTEPAALDADAKAYNDFVGALWGPAFSYDTSLFLYYQGKYNLKTVAQLGSTLETSDFVNRHYGDWPAPEIFVPNKK